MLLFSIVIPSYNNVELLVNAVSSVLIQDWDNFEIIIVDDSISNEIEHYITELGDKRIIYSHNTPPLGAVNNWNYGISLIKGDYCILMHHDEMFSTPDYLSRLKFEIQKGFDVVVSNIEVKRSGRSFKGISFIKNKGLALRFPFLLFAENFIGPCACLTIRKDKLQYFDPSLKWIVDVDWYYRLIHYSKVGYLRDLFIISNDGHQDQITNTIDVNKECKKDLTYINIKYKWNLFVRISAIFAKYGGLSLLKGRITNKILRINESHRV